MQPTLFDNDQPIAEGPSHPPCFYTMLARELLGAGDDWIVAQMECLNVSRGSDEIPPDKLQILLTGAVYPNKRGSKWGKPKNDSQRKIVVTEAQRIACRLRWEASTGKCSECGGCGQHSRGWSRDDGSLWAPCPRCKATGVAPVEVA